MTIVELKDLIQDNFEADDIVLKHDLNKVSVFFDMYTSQGEVTLQHLDIVVTGSKQNVGRQGVHVFIEDAADDFRIVSAIESALKDDFNCVYVHLNYGKAA